MNIWTRIGRIYGPKQEENILTRKGELYGPEKEEYMDLLV